MPLDALQERLAGLAERSESLAVRPKVVGLLDTLQEAGLGAAAARTWPTRTVAADLVGTELDLVWWTSVLGRIGALDPRYAGHDGEALRARGGAVRPGRQRGARGPGGPAARRAGRAGPAGRGRPSRAGGRAAGLGRRQPGRARRRPAGPAAGGPADRPAADPVRRPGRRDRAVLVDEPAARPRRCCRRTRRSTSCWSPRRRASTWPARPRPSPAGASLVVVGDPRLARRRRRESLADVALSRLPSARPARVVPAGLGPSSPRSPVRSSGPSGRVATDRPTVGGPVRRARPRRGRDWRLRPARPGRRRRGPRAGRARRSRAPSRRCSTSSRLVMDHARDRPEQSLAVVALNRLHADRIRDAVRLERGVHPRVASSSTPTRPSRSSWSRRPTSARSCATWWC